ncbi:hypothetical protein DFH07DRAFT_948372 [Mycena maculata]|uniref:Membrane-associated protein n=1 Tax=Mycena maculata TaxID=230809 RepID=A0AAD7P2T7_9AGAR|nr:hypothetical protein DFH07DRAFT_948372 [Mycena maculata]
MLKALISLAIVVSTALVNACGQCQQSAGYLGAFNASTANFAVAVATTLGDTGIFMLDTSGNTLHYLSIVTFSNKCDDGGPVFVQILSPVDPAVGYVSLVAGADFLCISYSRNHEDQGSYGNLKTFCGKSMTFALGTAVSQQVLLPTWMSLHALMGGVYIRGLHTSLLVVQDSTFNRLLATPNPATYSAFYLGATVQQVHLSLFI